jgi:hypothetical protein
MHAVSSQRNRLLKSLSRDDLGLLQEHFEPVTLKLRQQLEKPNRRIEDVYFPESGSPRWSPCKTTGPRRKSG